MKTNHHSPITSHQSEQAFTMIELLVTVSLVAILSAIGISTFLGAQRYNRDQRRVRDLQTVKQALELYRSSAGSYPQAWDLVNGVDLSYGGKVYLEASAGAVPKDPVSGRSYLYLSLPAGCDNDSTTPAPPCGSFALCASEEGSASYGLPGECNGSSCGTDSCDFGVTSD